MKTYIFCLIFLFSCASPRQMFEATCTSSTQSMKDKVFLASYQIEPHTLKVGNVFFLDIKESFIEERYIFDFKTKRVQILDTSILRPKLVIIASSSSILWSALPKWDAEIYDADSAYSRKNHTQSLAYMQNERTMVLRLHPMKKFEKKPISILFKIKNDADSTETFIIKCIPL